MEILRNTLKLISNLMENLHAHLGKIIEKSVKILKDALKNQRNPLKILMGTLRTSMEISETLNE